MSKPEPGAIFDTASAVRSAVTAMPRIDLPASEAPPLSPEALAVTAKPYRSAYSPIVLAGLVRAIEFMLVATIGFAIYVCYVVPIHGFAGTISASSSAFLCSRAGVPGRRHLSGPGVSRP